MPRLSSAFKRFEARLSEVDHLRYIARGYLQLRPVIRNRSQVDHANALVRSATVLLSSHIQGYIEDLMDVVMEHMINDGVSASLVPESLRYYATKSAIREMRDSNDPSKIIQKIRTYAQDYGDVLLLTGPAPASLASLDYKGGFGNPTVDEIRKFLSRFGLTDFHGQMAQKLKNEWPIIENAINQIVDRRNKIAHGDVLATLTVNELSQYTKIVRKFASNTDRTVTSHFSQKGCRFWG
jgi:hypothetical protein